MRKTFGLSAMFVLAVALLSSCTSQKNLIYLQGSEDMNGDILHTYSGDEKNYSPEYVLAEQDMLYIQITSTVGNEANALFNNTTNNNYVSSDNAVFLNSFVIDKEGEIGLPLMGKVYVKGLTVEQAEKKIKEKAEEFVQGAVVSCKMVNYKVCVFDVIAAAGDLTYYGNRHRVKVVRKTSKEDLIYTLDLSEASILQDKKFYLQPGDLVYVEPNKNTKALTTLNVPLNTITSSLSILTSVISVVSLILTLSNK